MNPQPVIFVQDEAEQVLGHTTSGKTSVSELARLCRYASVTLPDQPDTISRLRQTGMFVLTPQDGDGLSAVVREAYRLYEQRDAGGEHVTVALVLREDDRDALSTTDQQLWAELCTGAAARRGVCTFVLRDDKRLPDRRAQGHRADHFLTGRTGDEHEL